MSLVGYVLGAYDPFSSSIRLPYDVSPTENALNDPTLAHEVTHYGQSLLTFVGCDLANFLHGVYYATSHILEAEPKLHLPLSSVPLEERSSQFWGDAEFARKLIEEIIGGVSAQELFAFANKMQNYSNDLFSELYNPESINPIWLTGIAGRESSPYSVLQLVFGEDGQVRVAEIPPHKEAQPTLEIQFKDGQRFSFIMDGSFFLELHAHLIAFISYATNNDLDENEQLEYFFFSQNSPYLLPTLAVERLLVQRLGIGSFVDAVYVCHLCCVIALNWIRPDAAPMGVTEVTGSHRGFRYIPPGKLFARALGAALEHLTYHGQAVAQYFSVFRRVIETMKAASFESTIENLVGYSKRLAESAHPQPDSYSEFLFDRWMEMQPAIQWWKDAYTEERVDDFVLAPLELLARKKISSPLILGPEKFSTIGGIPAKPGHIRAMIFSVLTRKLWSETDLTCSELRDQPFDGSVIGCSEENKCPSKQITHEGVKLCDNSTWEQVLADYGLDTETLGKLKGAYHT